MSRRWLLLAFIPLFLVLGVAAYLTVVFANGERSEQGWVVHTYQVIDSLRSLTTDIANAETAQSQGSALASAELLLAHLSPSA